MKTVKSFTTIGGILRTARSISKTTSKKQQNQGLNKIHPQDKCDNIIKFSKYYPGNIKTNRANSPEDDARIIDNERASGILNSVKLQYFTAPGDIILAQANSKPGNIINLLH